MFYEPGKTEHNLPHDPFKACVIPRPIGWISTVSATGEANLAPYSQFNNLTFDPPYVMFSANQTPSGKQKDTTVNTETTGKFCWNLATWDLREAVNITAEQVAPGVDEFERAGLKKEMSKRIDGVPMVADSPVKFECEYYTTLRLPGNPPMGSVDYTVVTETFEMIIPTNNQVGEDVLGGLEGSTRKHREITQREHQDETEKP
ncbi:Nitrilotriacetate monooxygenase component B protein [Phytophthora nicotianae]|uniref:Nitrilotriacetate monooxygenase component B protein n=1 Tax=Phytophthora nicotianae TaxID=4792 RepID=A0A0W8DVB3_PHYNI|nr:Nitrilotriacetate monooxygenase component B protein [Phytophthora nicotianae]